MIDLIAMGVVCAGSVGSVIVNPGFEDGLSGWSFTQPAAASISGSVVHSGSAALRFVVPQVSGTSIAFQNVAQQSGPFELSFWLRVDRALPAGALFDVSIGSSPFFVVPAVSPDTWTFVDLSAMVPPGIKGNQWRLYLEGSGANIAGINVFLDDVRFGTAPSPGALAVLTGAALRRRTRRAGDRGHAARRAMAGRSSFDAKGG